MSRDISARLRTEAVARLRAAGCVFAEDEARLLVAEASTSAELDAMVRRRAAGEPLEQVLGWAEFCGRRMAVEPGVFVPRRRTELLAREAVALARQVSGRAAVVVELCCGVGALGAALAAVADVELHAVDIDSAAVRCARRNIGAAGDVYEGDLYEPLPATLRGRVDVLMANVPYVPTEEIRLMPPEARVHEPRVALDGGADGLDVLRRVSRGGSGWLAPGGHLLFETSERQVSAAAENLRRDGLIPRVVMEPELDATVVVAMRPASLGEDVPH